MVNRKWKIFAAAMAPVMMFSATAFAGETEADAAVAETKAQYEGYISPEAHQTALDAAKAESKSYELKYLKLDAALKAGLPIELADKISGETAEDIQKDAESFAQITCKSTHQPRRFSPEHNDAMTGVEREFYARNPKLKEN